MEAQVVFNLGLATGFFLGLAASAFLTQATLHLSEVFSHLVDRLLSSFRRRIGS
jgi:hypothetical protein